MKSFNDTVIPNLVILFITQATITVFVRKHIHIWVCVCGGGGGGGGAKSEENILLYFVCM